MTQVNSSADNRTFLPPGKFTVGANYWASHAGTDMWRDWQPDVVASDLERLAAAGLQMLRVFPLWPDFQPIHSLRGFQGMPREIRFEEDALLVRPGVAPDGVAPVMLERFGILADLAHRNGLTLVVGLITGWMSGRLFVPPALDGLDPITDPLSIMWQCRMATRIVHEFKGHPAIAAWDLGNECNCMGQATREQAWVWTATLTGAIRSADPTLPIVSGMHALSIDPSGAWAIRDQAELTDVLTTHPYPYWTPHCSQDRIDSLRPALHATAETRLYADIGGRPAFAEEIGTMGPMLGNEQAAAAFARASLYSLWAHDCRAAFWWCAFDQGHLAHAPYDWNACETELGLLRANGAAKPVAQAIGDLSRTLSCLPFESLPPRVVEGVCLLTPGQDSWGVGQSAFLLAKQAGFDLSYAYIDAELPDSSLYVLPSLNGLTALTRHRAKELMARVRNGATLYVSLGDAFLFDFEELTGTEVIARRNYSGSLSSRFEEVNADLTWESRSSIQYLLNTTRAIVLGRNADGNPVFTCATCGEGKVYFLGFPLEAEQSQMPGVFQDGSPMWHLYREFAREAMSTRVLTKSAPQIGITEHVVSERERIAVLLNYEQNLIHELLSIATDWRVTRIDRGREPLVDGDHLSVDLPGMDAAIWQLTRL